MKTAEMRRSYDRNHCCRARKFRVGYYQHAELVVGKPENYEYIDFLQGESQEALEDDYREKLNNLKDCEK